MLAREHINQVRRERLHRVGISQRYISKYGGKTDTKFYNGKQYLMPWAKTYKRIITRCIYDKNHPYYKKIKCLITIRELEILWFRDGASKLSQPSIDRIKGKANYTFDNCRYIELEKNQKRKRIEV